MKIWQSNGLFTLDCPPSSPSAAWDPGRQRRTRLGNGSYGDLATISPTIMDVFFCLNLSFTPLARYGLNRIKVFSEIMVGEIVVKSPYEWSPCSRQPDLDKI